MSDQDSVEAKKDSKMEKIFREMDYVKETLLRVSSKSVEIHDALLGIPVPPSDTYSEKAPEPVGKLDIISDQLSYIRGILNHTEVLLSAVSRAVCK